MRKGLYLSRGDPGTFEGVCLRAPSWPGFIRVAFGRTVYMLLNVSEQGQRRVHTNMHGGEDLMVFGEPGLREHVLCLWLTQGKPGAESKRGETTRLACRELSCSALCLGALWRDSDLLSKGPD